MKFAKRPVVIDAVQFDGDNWSEIDQFTNFCFRATWLVGPIVAEVYDEIHDTWVGVRKNDWIIRGVKGEFYPCDNEVFQDTYEEATSD
jgi:hypothetical protein